MHERHEHFAEHPRTRIELTGIRRNGDDAAVALRESLPRMLAGMLTELPGSVMQFDLFTDATGVVTASVTAEQQCAAASLGDEVRALLEVVAELDTRNHAQHDTGLGAGQWAVEVSKAGHGLGFGATSVSSSAAVAAAGAPIDELLGVLSSVPGEGIRVRLRAHTAADTWSAAITVLSCSAAPSLRLRSAVRRHFPGLAISLTSSDLDRWMQVDGEALSRVCVIPISGTDPLPGVVSGPAAAIPTAPSRPQDSLLGNDTSLHIGDALTVGRTKHAVRLTAEERVRHLHILGRTGTGKSTALASLLHSIAGGEEGAIVLDTHGQLVDRVVAEAPDEVRQRLWVIRCGDADNPVPLNPLAETDPAARDIAIDEVCAMFQYLFDKKETGIVGPRFHQRVSMVLQALAAVHGPRTSLLDVPIAMSDDAFMRGAVDAASNDRLTAWWDNDKTSRRSNEYGEVNSWVNSKFEGFSSTPALRGVLGSGADAINFSDEMDRGRIILVDLSKAQLGESAARLLGYLYLQRVWAGALRRRNPTRTFTVVVDEAQTLISGSLTNMLAEGRKFGLSVVLAHQYLDQLDSDLLPAVDGNVATTIAFRSSVTDAAQLHRRFGGLVDPAVLMTLPDLSAITLRTACVDAAAIPHTLIIDHNKNVLPRRGTELADHTAAVTSTSLRDLVEPHRDVTIPAQRGVSNVTAMPRPEGPAAGSSRPRPRPGRAREVTESSSQTPSFLDEWLARREAAHAGTEDSPESDSPESEGTGGDEASA